MLRNTDFLSFDMSSVRSSSFMSNIYVTPNGFDGEESCRIARYAGIGDKITSFGIFEYNQELDKFNCSLHSFFIDFSKLIMYLYRLDL